MHFLTLIAAAGTAALALAAPATSKKRASKLQFFGVNESGAEFGESAIPGVYNKDYTWYDLSTIDTFIAKGMNTFRINFLMERLIPNQLTGKPDAAYLGNLTQTINYITGKGAYAMVTPHNYGRYYNKVITDTAGFQAFWKTVATPYKSNSKVIFDTNNEYHDMSQTLVVQLNQAAINGIRAAGATTQYITPEGNAYTGAWTWTTATDSTTGKTNGQTMGALTDSANKLIYQMHQYLDSDGSGTSATCVSSTVFADRLVAATNWLRTNGKKGFIGEFAGGDNAQCITALKGGIAYLKANTDVWTGATWWSAGPWWGDYLFNAEPPNGIAYKDVLPSLYGA